MAKLRVILLSLAGFLLLVHSVVPHHHHEPSSVESCCHPQQSSGSSWWDDLGDLFHMDLGEDHLENLRAESGLSLAFPTLIAISHTLPEIFAPLPTLRSAQPFPMVDIPPPRVDFIPARVLRGPPASFAVSA